MTVYLALRVRDRVSLVGILNLYNVTKSIADAASGGVTVAHHEKTNYNRPTLCYTEEISKNCTGFQTRTFTTKARIKICKIQ